jgi:hypothetical protein
MSRVPYPTMIVSMYTWLGEAALPGSLRDEFRRNKSALAIVNTGAFDVFKGPFTQDSTIIVSLFTNRFRYVKDVPYKTAKRYWRSGINKNQPIYTKPDISTFDFLSSESYRPISRVLSKLI